MQRTIFVTVSDDRCGRKGGMYGKTQDKVFEFLSVDNPSFGITDYLFLKFEDILKTDFYTKNKLTLDIADPNINGRCYKPYAILEGLTKINDGDFLIYNDVSPELWKFIDTNKQISENYRLDIIKELCVHNGGILTAAVESIIGTSLENYHRHEFYTLDRCIKRMGLEEYTSSIQHASGMVVLQKSEKTLRFVEEWLRYNLIDECASLGTVPDDPAVKIVADFWGAECDRKLGHRHDQSISGLLINKMNNKLVIAPASIYPMYNFLSYCIVGGPYHFIDSNQPKTNRILKLALNHEKNIWEVETFDRHAT
jgi:hypothetical protein